MSDHDSHLLAEEQSYVRGEPSTGDSLRLDQGWAVVNVPERTF